MTDEIPTIEAGQKMPEAPIHTKSEDGIDAVETAPIAPMMAALVDDGKLVMLKADWTRPDPRIAAFLASHDRFGIPFNIIYGPKAPEGVLLGELLRADIVENALIKAGMVR